MCVWYQLTNDTIFLHIQLQPNAKQSGWGQTKGAYKKLYVQAPPKAGKANQQAIAYIAKSLRVAKKNIELKRGHNARCKLFSIPKSQSILDALANLP